MGTVVADKFREEKFFKKNVDDNNYYNRNNRMNSFNGCKKIEELQRSYEDDENLKEDLAAGGFYYNQYCDQIRCFCCNMLLDLKKGENPIAKHWLENQDCNFIKDIYCSSPTSKGYTDERKRIQTFGLWPRALNQRPRAMAEAGFIYTGVGDKVQCFYCDGKFSNWEETDDPFEEHAYWIPTCQFVIISKGLEYVENIQRNGRSIKPVRRQKSEAVTKPISTEDIADYGMEKTSSNCAVCYDKQRNICFEPCGHIVVCASCSFDKTSCPICRVAIESRIKITFY